MISFFRNLIRTYLYSSLHIAIIASVMFYLFHPKIMDRVLTSLAFGILVLLYYNSSRILRIKNFEDIHSNPHLTWVSKNLTELIFLIGLSSVVFVLILFRIDYSNINTPYFLLGLGMLYPFVRQKQFLKNIIIAQVWCLGLRLFQFDSQFLFAYLLFISLWYDFKDEKNIDLSKIVLCALVLFVSTYIIFIKYEVAAIQIALFIFLNAIVFGFTLIKKNELVLLFIPDLMLLLTSLYLYSLENS